MTVLPDLRTTVTGLYVGRPKTLWPGRPASSIARDPVNGPARLGWVGFEGDQPSDLTAHGGPEKALHHYPAAHYPFWQAELGASPAFRPGGFGENLSTDALTEETVCIGDVFRLGSAEVQISQGRQPCWKLVAHAGHDEMAYLVRRRLRTGWYYRVLAEGEVRVSDAMVLLDRPHPDWTLARVMRALFDPRVGAGEAAHLADLTHMTADWRAWFAGKAG